MYKATLTNTYIGTEIDLTADESRMQVISIKGLSSSSASINTSVVTGLSGVIVNSKRAEPRNIVITLQLNDAEDVRQELEDLFYPTADVRFKYKTGDLDVYIDGSVESFECDPFEQGQKAQISILCPQPYFLAVNEQTTNISGNVLAVPIPNLSNIPMGVVVNVTFLAAASKFSIGNEVYGTMAVEYEFETDDVLIIDTRVGSKKITLTRHGTTTNITSHMAAGSKFFVLRAYSSYISANSNTVIYEVDDRSDSRPTKTTTKVIYRRPYAGV